MSYPLMVVMSALCAGHDLPLLSGMVSDVAPSTFRSSRIVASPLQSSMCQPACLFPKTWMKTFFYLPF